MVYFLVSAVAYLIGSIPTGVLVSRWKYGVDVREVGSGNIGATNVTRVFGWAPGLMTLAIDFFKGFLPVLAVQRFFPSEPALEAWCAGFVVFGHCYSLFLRFRGGKGVATGVGCLCLVVPWAAALAALVYLLLILSTKVSAVGSLGGVAVVLLYTAAVRPAAPQSTLIFMVCFVVVLRHQSNIRRWAHRFLN